MEYVEGKYAYILKSGETSSIYPSYPLTTLFNSDIYLRTIKIYYFRNLSQLVIIISTSFLFSKLSAILIKLC